MKNLRLERYLNSATQGIVGKKRAQIQEELRGNLEQRAKELMAFGTAEKPALEQALNEFGAPKLVSRGMAQLYTLPWVNRTLGFGGILAATFATALLTSAQKIQVESITPQFPCNNSTKGLCTYSASYINFDTLVKFLNVHGSQFKIKENKFYQITVDNQAGQGSYGVSSTSSDKFSISQTAFIKNGNHYLDSSSVLEVLSNIGWPVYFSNLSDPKITINGKLINFESDKPVVINRFLAAAISSGLHSSNSNMNGYGYIYPDGLKMYEKLNFNGLSRKAYAIISLPSRFIGLNKNSKSSSNPIQIDIAQADSSGIVRLPIISKNMSFMTSYTEFKKQNKYNTAIVLPLTGRLDKDLLDEQHPLLPLKK